MRKSNCFLDEIPSCAIQRYSSTTIPDGTIDTYHSYPVLDEFGVSVSPEG